MRFDRVLMVDWSAAGDRGAAPKKDAIWAAEARDRTTSPPVYLRNRVVAAEHIDSRVAAALAAGERLLLGFDFPFGYPAGFAQALTGEPGPKGVWRWMAEHLADGPKQNNRFDLAGRINGMFPGVGPFWFNGLRRDIAALPRKDVRHGHGMAERRRAEDLAKGAFTCWQMGGAGAVGGQVMTGMAQLHRLTQRWGDALAFWPFDPLDAPVAVVEIWPGLLDGAVRAEQRDDEVRDAAQVRVLAGRIAALTPERLAAMLDVTEPEEGWILGLGFEDELAGLPKAPPLRDSCFAMPRGVDWVPVDSALALLRERLTAVVEPEFVPLAEAAGRTLASNLAARRSHPPQANSAVDGYGFGIDAAGGTEVRLPLLDGRAAAGAAFPGAVPEGSALRILTGAALPPGVDTVVLEEDVAAGAGHVAFRSGLKRGANTRAAGEDVVRGGPILDARRVLTPGDIALAAATGHSALPVFRTLRVAVLSTGDELAEPGTERPGETVDANRPMLTALLGRWGLDVVDLGIARDRREAVAAALDRGAREADVILTSGGASAGDEDHVSALLNETGSMALWRIALKPGRPLALGLWQGVPVFGLPGNPVAAMVCTLIFARPALAVLGGAHWPEPRAHAVPAAFSKSKKAGRREYLRARFRKGRAEVYRSEGSGRISGLSWAEGLVELPDGAAEIRPGTRVRYLPFEGFDP